MDDLSKGTAKETSFFSTMISEVILVYIHHFQQLFVFIAQHQKLNGNALYYLMADITFMIE